ncbi:MAG TPA: 4-alpha-glucanotransferase, partial [Dokdonella sp.]
CDTPGQIADSRRRLAAQARSADPPPLAIVAAGRTAALHAAAHAGRRFRVDVEGGATLDGRIGGDGRLALPRLDPGYHRLHVGGTLRTIAAVPRRCFALDEIAPARAKRWGLAAQIYALRRNGDDGVGDFGALAELAAASGRAGADALAISPVHAMFAAAPERRSPYSPSSRRFLNALLIDPAERFGAGPVAAAAQALGLDAAPAPADLVDWPGAARRKLALLRELYRAHAGRDAALDAELDAFRTQRGAALARHARFEALHARHRGAGRDDWRRWPARERTATHADRDDAEAGFHVFLQWLAERGLAHAQRSARAAGLAIGLIADLAVGSDPAGSDAWALGDAMLRGVTVGAPPDAFTPLGQNWGLTTFSPAALRADGYAGFLAALRAAMRHAGGVRIDHVMSLMRLWLVPDGADARDGAYVDYPFDALLGLVALESRRRRCIVVGEDLGVVPDGFRAALRRAGVLGLDVLWFMRGAGFRAPQRWRRDAVAMTTTHDLPTLAGWWRGADVDLRERIGLYDDASAAAERAQRARDRRALARAIRAALPDAAPDARADAAEFVDAAVAFVGASRCALALLPLEDACALDAQPNLPGTVHEYPNWCRRLPAPAPRLLARTRVRRRLRALAAARRRP